MIVYISIHEDKAPHFLPEDSRIFTTLQCSSGTHLVHCAYRHILSSSSASRPPALTQMSQLTPEAPFLHMLHLFPMWCRCLEFPSRKPRIYNSIFISHPQWAIFLSFCLSLLYFSPMCYRCVWLFFSVQMWKASSVCSRTVADLWAPGIPFHLPRSPLISFLHFTQLPISSL